MCFMMQIKKKVEPHTALVDLTVYKLVRRDNLESAYRFYPYKVDVVEKQPMQDTIRYINKNKYLTVKEGLHSFAHIEDAKEALKWLNTVWFNNYTIYRAEIPQGAKYYINLIGDIVSEELVLRQEYKGEEQDG